jgi:hypothetical protein
VGLGLTFVVAAIGALVGHLDTSVGRRVLARLVSEQATASLAGTIAIRDVRHVGLRSLAIGEVTVQAPDGATVIAAEDVSVEYDLFALAGALLATGGRFELLEIERVRVRALTLSSIDDGRGAPTLARAFAPRHPSPTPGAPSSFRLAVRALAVDGVRLEAALAGRQFSARGRLDGGSVAVDPEATRVHVGELHLVVAPIEGATRADAVVELRGDLDLLAHAPPSALPITVRGLRARLQSGDSDAIVEGSFDGARQVVDARVTARTLRHELTRASGLPPMAEGEAAVTLTLKGTLPRLEIVAVLSAPGAVEARTTGWLDLDALFAAGASGAARREETPIADAQIELLDARAAAFSTRAPPITASASARLRVGADASGTTLLVDGDASLRADGFVASATDPPLKLAAHARAHRDRDGAVTAAGALGLALDDAHADVDFVMDQAAAAHPRLAPARSRAFLRVRGGVSTLSPLSPLAALRLPIRGAIDFDAGADVDLAAGSFAMSGTVGVRALVADAGTIPRLVLRVRAGGPFAQPRFDAEGAAAEVRLAGDARGPGESLRDVFVRATGSPTEFRLTTSLRTSRAQQVALAASIDRTQPGLRVHDLEGSVARGGFRAELGLRELTVRGTAVTIRGLRLASTAGGVRLDGTIDRARRRYDLDLASTPLDVAQLAEGLAIELHGARGFVTVHATTRSLPGDGRVDLALAPADDRGMLRLDLDAPRLATAARRRDPGEPRLTGTLHVELTDGWAAQVGAVEGRVHLMLDDRLVEGGARFAIKELVDADFRVGGVLAGGLDDFERALRASIGHVDLAIHALDLERLQAFLARHGSTSGAAPAGDGGLAGLVEIGGRITREAEGAPPAGALWATTKGLSLVRDGTVFAGVDVAASASMTREVTRPSPGVRAGERVQLGLDVRAVDAHGPLASMSVAVSAGWAEVQALARGEATLDRRRLLDQPFRASLSVPRRKVRELPDFLRKEIPVGGTLAAELRLDGTLLAPSLLLDATIADVRAPDGVRQTLGLHATYDGKRARTHVEIGPSVPAATAASPATAATASFVADAEVVIDVASVVAAPRGPASEASESAEGAKGALWTASVDATVKRLPLAMFPALGSTSVSGTLSGELHVAGLHDLRAGAPTVKGSFAIDDFLLGTDRFERAAFAFHADTTGAGATVVLRGPAGALDFVVGAPLTWTNSLLPSLTPSGAVTTTIVAKGLRLKPFEALVASLDELDGRLDVDLRGSLRVAAAKPGAAANLVLPESLDLEGTIRLADGTVVVGAIGERWQHVGVDVAFDKTKIALKKLHLEGGGGRADATGDVTLVGTSPQALHFELETERLPFSTDGVPVGDLSGKVVIDGDLRDSALAKVEVTISPMTLELAARSDKKPQELVDDASIVVMQPIRKPTPLATLSARTPLRVVVHLPQNVWIRRDDLLIAVRGAPTLVVGRGVTVAGELSVDRGWVQVLGKRFVLDHGTVRFDGATELNPTLDLAVKWDAPDGSKVTIAITGRMQTPKITLSADPPGTPAEIMSLLALGRRDAGSAAKQAQAEQGAAMQTAAVVQGFTGALLGKQLQKILPSGMSLNLQPGGQGLGDVKIGGGYQLSNVYFEVGYQAGARQPVGTSTQAPPRTTFGIEWRFKPAWSLLTTLGDTGSAAVDLVWNYRY